MDEDYDGKSQAEGVNTSLTRGVCFIMENIHTADSCQVNTGRAYNAGVMLGQRRRRWPYIKPALVQRLVRAVYGADRSAQIL